MRDMRVEVCVHWNTARLRVQHGLVRWAVILRISDDAADGRESWSTSGLESWQRQIILPFDNGCSRTEIGVKKGGIIGFGYVRRLIDS